MADQEFKVTIIACYSFGRHDETIKIPASWNLVNATFERYTGSMPDMPRGWWNVLLVRDVPEVAEALGNA